MPEHAPNSRLVLLNGLLMLTVIGLSITLAWETRPLQGLLKRKFAEHGEVPDPPPFNRVWRLLRQRN